MLLDVTMREVNIGRGVGNKKAYELVITGPLRGDTFVKRITKKEVAALVSLKVGK